MAPRLEYDQTKGFSSSVGAKLFKTHVRLTEAEAELLKLKFGKKESNFSGESNSSAEAKRFHKYH